MLKLKYFSLFVLLIVFFPLYQSMAQTVNIAGSVTEKISGEYVIGITVALYSSDTTITKPLKGVYTNKFGFYSIPGIGKGNYILVAQGIGYNKYIEKIEVKSNNDLIANISIGRMDVRTQEVIVEAERSSGATKGISSVDISPSFVDKISSIGAEKDLFRVLQLLPGVTQASELSSGLYIRGSTPDQVLYLLDGVTVYNPGHMAGFLSTFNNDALKDVRLIKGAFPAEYGGRLSSILDVSMKEGTKEKFSGAGGISTLTSRLTLEGPIGEDLTFMVSGRFFHPYFYYKLGESIAAPSDVDAGYYFYDLNAKVNYKISESDRIFISGYFGRDVLYASSENEFGTNFNWGNKTGNFRWMHIVSPKLFTNFSLIYSDYNYNLTLDNRDTTQGQTGELFSTTSGITDIVLRGEAQYFPFENHVIKSGLETTWHTFKSFAQSIFFDDIDMKAPVQTIKALDAALYLQDEWKVTELFSTNIGCRLYYFQEGNYLGLEPRFSAKYAITDNFSVFTAASLTNQFLHLLIRNDITLPTDLWFPSTSTIKPSQAYQGVLGIETLLGGGDYQFTVEGYYKKMMDIYDYKDDADFNFGVPLQEQFTTGWGEAYGVEFFLHKRVGSFTGWIGYTLAWVTHHFDELNEGKAFSPRYDIRNDFEVTITYELSEEWEIGATWNYRTGQAYTMPSGVYNYSEVPSMDSWYYSWERYQYTDRNGFRLPSYQRLDLNLMYKYEWFGLPFELDFNIYNAYNYKNPFAWYISDESYWDERTQEYIYKKVVKQITIFPLIPSIGINFKF
ncbi:MAG: TonB-dependent receptor [bacterium]